MTAVIFDLDGTLIDSAAAICSVANSLLSEIGVKPITPAESRGFMGYGAPRFLEQVLAFRGVDGADQDRNLKRFLELYEAAPADANPPFAGAQRALEALIASGCRLALCTNKPDAPTMKVLKALKWEGLFSAIVTGDTLPQRKPAPEPLLAAARQLGASRNVFVGDSEVDAQAAHAARLPFILHEEGYRKSSVAEMGADASFASYDQLPRLLATMALAA